MTDRALNDTRGNAGYAGHGKAARLPLCSHRADPASRCDHCGVRHVAVCAALSDRELRDLEQIMSRRVLQPGEMLICEGDEGAFAFNVISGALKLYKALSDGRSQIVGYLLPGDFLGLPLRGRYAYSVDAIGATELCQFPRDPLRQVFDRHESLQDRFLCVVHDELAAAQEHMLLLGRKTAEEKLCTFLLQLLVRMEQCGGPVEPLHVPLHRNDIADYLGLTVETVSRSFTRLRKNALIRLDRADSLFVVDRAALESLAGGR